MKRIAVLTSGGDASGMNSCLEVIFKACQKNKHQLFAFQYGFTGLVENNFKKLTKLEVANIYNLGGSIIKTARSAEFNSEEGVKKAYKNLIKNRIDTLIIIGGNGSVRGAGELQMLGADIICIPGTIDNDLYYTNQTLGFDTAVNNSVDAIVKIKQTMRSNDRGVVVETMGRNCPDIAIYSAVASQADILITENQSFDKILKDVKKVIKERTKSPLIIVKENLLDVAKLAEYLKEKTNTDFKSSVIGYLQRGGEPTVFDKILATQFASFTIDLINKGKTGKAVGIVDGKLISVDIDDAIKYNEQHENTQLLDIFKSLNS